MVSLLFTILSFGQDISNKDTLKSSQEKSNNDSLKSPREKSNKDTLKSSPEKPNNDSLKSSAEKPGKPILSNSFSLDNKDIIGKWQMESTEIADGYYYTYSFLRGNIFVFGNDENEGLNRIISLSGTYYLKKDTLIIYVKEEHDLVGGTPQMSEKLAGSGWEIKGGKIVTKDLPVIKQYYLPIKPCTEKDGKKCIEINSMSYYKLE
ncbi:MAG: hypothetical protein ACHQD8_02825 [Chitinophagales bacterium]